MKRWWNFWSEKAVWERAIAKAQTEQVLEHKAMDDFISEPVRSIVLAMIGDRKRFIAQRIERLFKSEKTEYEILDMDTNECFFVSASTDVHYYGIDTYYRGPDWATHDELKWAFEVVATHYQKLENRAKRILAIRERNRLINIYKGDL
jgi:hypothetical protein